MNNIATLPLGDRMITTGALAGKFSSDLNRLLHEISWEGNARHYRKGGRGRENVLALEVFHALQLLPRSLFFGGVLDAASGAVDALQLLRREVELMEVALLPGDISLARKPDFNVQPDGIIESPSVLALLEVKRIKPGSFQREQLAREYTAVLQEAGRLKKRPLLLLVLPKAPPVPVKGGAPMNLAEAIGGSLAGVLRRCSTPPTECPDVNSVVAYVTWPAIRHVLSSSRDAFTCDDPSATASVRRLAQGALDAIAWHGSD